MSPRPRGTGLPRLEPQFAERYIQRWTLQCLEDAGSEGVAERLACDFLARCFRLAEAKKWAAHEGGRWRITPAGSVQLERNRAAGALV